LQRKFIAQQQQRAALQIESIGIGLTAAADDNAVMIIACAHLQLAGYLFRYEIISPLDQKCDNLVCEQLVTGIASLAVCRGWSDCGSLIRAFLCCHEADSFISVRGDI